jgi:O-antigen/teichoic acid export membrane protein
MLMLFLGLSVQAALLLSLWGREFLLSNFSMGEEGLAFFNLTLFLALAMSVNEMSLNLFQGIRRMSWVAVSQVLMQGLLALHFILVRGNLEPAYALKLYAIYFAVPGFLMLAAFPFLIPRGGEGNLRIRKGEIFSYWKLGLLLRWMVLAAMDLDRYFLSFFASMELIAFFNIPARIMGVSRRLLQSSITSLQTEVSRLHEERRDSDLPARLGIFLRGQVSLSLWMATLLFLLAHPLILLVSSEDYLKGLPLLAILLLTLPLSSLSSPLEAAFRGTRGLGKVLTGNLIWALAYFGSFPFLVRGMGLVGLGVAQVGALLLQALWMLWMGRRLGLLGKGPLASRLIRSLFPSITALLVAFLIPGARGLSPSLAGMLLGSLVLLLHSLLLLRGSTLFSREEKAWLLGRVRPAPFRERLETLLGVGEGKA